MHGNEKVGRSPLDLVQAVAYNREVATLMGDLAEKAEKLDASFRKAVDLAKAMGADENKISKAELSGRWKAAVESGNEKMEKFYRQALDDLDPDNAR